MGLEDFLDLLGLKILIMCKYFDVKYYVLFVVTTHGFLYFTSMNQFPAPSAIGCKSAVRNLEQFDQHMGDMSHVYRIEIFQYGLITILLQHIHCKCIYV